MDFETKRAISRAVYKEHMRVYHEYIKMPTYVFRFRKAREKERLGHYLDGLNEWGKRLHEEFERESGIK